MNNKIRSVALQREADWSLLRAFLEVARAGSLSRAAQTLGTSQPTLSRQMAQLEAHVGQALFERTTRGVRLTEAGAELCVPAQRMREQATHFELSAAARSPTLAGTVRVTASEVFSAYVLPPILSRLREDHPEIQVELVASNELENLLERQADLALRMQRPGQAELVARRLPDQPIGIYAHRDYLQRHGMPDRGNFLEHRWVGFDRSDLMLRGFRGAGFDVDKSLFGFRCDNQIVVWQSVLAGMGLGVIAQRVAQQSPHAVRVLSEISIPALPLWVTAHRELRDSARLKLVFDWLCNALTQPLPPEPAG